MTTEGSSGRRTRKNSKADADAGKDYIPEEKPKDLKDVQEILFLYGYYLKKWGLKVDKAVHHLAKHKSHPPGHGLVTAEGEDTEGGPLTHLDPPPPPWEE